MGALTIESISSVQPILTDKDIELIASNIINEADNLCIGEKKPLQYECANGFKIDAVVEDKGFSYMRILCRDVYVYDSDNHSYDIYEDSIRDIVDTYLCDKNFKFEDDYYSQPSYSEMLEEYRY